MRRLAERSTAVIRAFWQQRDDLVLVLQADDVDMPPVLRIVETLEEQVSFAWCWIFAQPFASPAAYADTVVADIAAKRSIVCAHLAEAGKPAWPDLPVAAVRPDGDPVERLRAACVYVRGLVPPVAGGVTVFALLPTKASDPAAYAALVSELVSHHMPFPWCTGIRFMLRDDPHTPRLASLLSLPRIHATRVDFAPPTLEAALKQEADDPAAPEFERMTAGVVAAGMAEAHGRTTEALARYQAAFAHFGPAGNATMTALAAHGIAGCMEKLGDTAAAERIWVAALDAAIAANPPAFPVLLNILLGLVMLVARQGRWFEVEAYTSATQLIAHVLFMPAVKAEAQERCGIAQMRQSKWEAAESSFRGASVTADTAEEAERSLSARTLLLQLLRRQRGRDAEARELAAEIARLQQAAGHTHAGKAHA